MAERASPDDVADETDLARGGERAGHEPGQVARLSLVKNDAMDVWGDAVGTATPISRNWAPGWATAAAWTAGSASGPIVTTTARSLAAALSTADGRSAFEAGSTSEAAAPTFAPASCTPFQVRPEGVASFGSATAATRVTFLTS